MEGIQLVYIMLKLKIKQKFIRQSLPDFETKYAAIINDDADVFVSIGGDNYCYGYYAGLSFVNKRLNEKGKKTVLWGCSIEPQEIKQSSDLRKDLSLYSLITARETLTYNALMEHGIIKNLALCPDPAFLLETYSPPVCEGFKLGNTVGINLSPLVQNLEQADDITFKNAVKLMEYILNCTDMNIALIPHVVWDMTNDKETLGALYNMFKNTGRVYFFDGDYNAMELKGIIAECRFMIAARTHASIAAYSSQVPTLVIGYSVKARGIAQDIFGKWQGYVLPVQDLRKEDDFVRAFKFIMINEKEIKARYKEILPDYVSKARQAALREDRLIV